MSNHLCITVRWLGDRFHGFTDDRSGPEWPPSPFRLLQALVAGAYQHGVYEKLKPVLVWLERQSSPDILAEHRPPRGNGFDHYVPDNDYHFNHKKPVVRVIEPVLLRERFTVTYIWRIDPSDAPPIVAIDDLCSTLSSFGCGVDQAFATARLAPVAEVARECVDEAARFRHTPSLRTASALGTLRTPARGTLDDLNRVFGLNRRNAKVHTERRKKRWPTVFHRVVYTGLATLPIRPYVVFKLFDENDDTYAHPHAKLIHIAGMVRHLAIERMTKKPPRGVNDPAGWVERYIAGHRDKVDAVVDLPHAQLSYVPLPSVGTPHTDPAVRRVMIFAPAGDDEVIHHLARQLDSMQLKPERLEHLRGPVFLQRVQYDGVIARYTDPSRTWASFTPVILPGHDDHKPEKTHKLILKALAQSGIDQPCQFEWSAFSRFPKSYSAHKYDRENRRIGYIRPDHLLNQTAVHLRLTFENEVPGPITLGAGRHCGFGLMAAVQEP